MASVSVNELDLNFGTVEVLKKLSIDVEEGEFLVLLGASGCGKSTLLNCIAGLLDVSGGQIFISDKNVTWEEPKDRGIGMVFQSYALYPQMTVRGNLSFGLKNQKVPAAEIDERVNRAAEILQIEALLDRKPAALSGGQRQRVAIGRALVRDVDVFLFDEPLSNLDAKLRSELRVEIKRLHQTLNNTMIYVTHDQIEALTLADRIAIMKSGVIQQLAPPLTIYNKPRNLFVAGFIGSPSMNFLHGKIVDRDGGLGVETKGEFISLDGYQNDSELVAGTDVVLGIRPEHIEVVASGGSHDAVVDLEEPMGSDNFVWVKFADEILCVRATADARFDVGQKVSLKIQLNLASMFDKNSELRL